MSGESASRWRHKWSEEDVAPILQTLPPLPARASLILRTRLHQLEELFILTSWHWRPAEPSPAKAAKELRTLARQARALAKKASETETNRRLRRGLSDELQARWDGLQELGRAPDANSPLPAPFCYVFSGTTRTPPEPSSRHSPRIYSEEHALRIIEDIRLLADGAEREAAALAARVRPKMAMDRRRPNAETFLLEMTFALYQHLQSLLPRTLPRKPGRNYDHYADEHERGRQVEFSLAVLNQFRQLHPQAGLHAVTPAGVAGAFRRWRDQNGDRKAAWLAPATHLRPAAKSAPGET